MLCYQRETLQQVVDSVYPTPSGQPRPTNFTMPANRLSRVYNGASKRAKKKFAVHPRTVAMMKRFYAPYNDRLRQFLTEHGVGATVLASWLKLL